MQLENFIMRKTGRCIVGYTINGFFYSSERGGILNISLVLHSIPISLMRESGLGFNGLVPFISTWEKDKHFLLLSYRLAVDPLSANNSYNFFCFW